MMEGGLHSEESILHAATSLHFIMHVANERHFQEQGHDHHDDEETEDSTAEVPLTMLRHHGQPMDRVTDGWVVVMEVAGVVVVVMEGVVVGGMAAGCGSDTGVLLVSHAPSGGGWSGVHGAATGRACCGATRRQHGPFPERRKKKLLLFVFFFFFLVWMCFWFLGFLIDQTRE